MTDIFLRSVLGKKKKKQTHPLTSSSQSQKCPERRSGTDARRVQGVQEDQGQTPPLRGPDQQTRFLQINLDPTPFDIIT